MQGVFQLPKFAVVMWLRKTASYQAAHEELLELAAEEPYESTEYQGMSIIIGALIEWFRRIDSPTRCAHLLKSERSSSCASRAETMQSRPQR